MINDSRLSELEPYLPSSSEKKQAVMMYMVVWLVLSMWKREISPYTHHHLKQSLGWLVFLMFIIFFDLVLVVLWLILSFFLWLAVLITIPTLIVGCMWIYQATKWKYIWEGEMINKFFMLFSGVWNWVLNLFDSNHYQIIDWERYRSEDQFYSKQQNKEISVDEWNDKNINNSNSTVSDWNISKYDLDIQNHEINKEMINSNKLDNEQKISISDWDIWIDLSNHEINDSHDFELEL